MAVIQTVLGPIAPEALGPTMMHEHLLGYWAAFTGGRPAWDDASVVDTLVGRLAELAALGGGGLVEMTPIGEGREPRLYAAVARRSPIPIVLVTGFYSDGFTPHPPVVRERDVDGLADLMVGELVEGIEDTGIRAGLIKVGTRRYEVSPSEEKVARAAARAQRRSGAAISTHTPTSEVALALLDILEAEGADPGRIVLGHQGLGAEGEPVADAATLARRGVYVGYDSIFPCKGRPGRTDSAWVRLILDVAERGCADRIVLSQDAHPFWWGAPEWESPHYAPPHYGHVLGRFVPLLLDAGLDRVLLETMLVTNPRRLLAF